MALLPPSDFIQNINKNLSAVGPKIRMSGLAWFRLYAELVSDPIIQSLAFEDQRHYVALLCLKCSGLLDRAIQPSRRDAFIARGLGLSIEAATEAKRRLQEVFLCDEMWQPTGWKKRQYESDNSTKRTRKYRKTLNTGNVPVTSPKRSRDVTVTPRTEQSRAEQNRTEKTPLNPPLGEDVPGLNPAAWGLWEKHHREIGKPYKQTGALQAMKKLAAFGNAAKQLSVVENCIAGNYQGLFDRVEKQNTNGNGRSNLMQGVL